jgi:hypothetical protein
LLLLFLQQTLTQNHYGHEDHPAVRTKERGFFLIFFLLAGKDVDLKTMFLVLSSKFEENEEEAQQQKVYPARV